ncbi:Glycosyl transferase family 2 [Rubripirellula obstinata]|uniref:Glycosyl transferase family 2 n=1 Tax=Rubripirellula obstinata TaxID=406547 RepID=A0A5B1CKM1_9BACT|nr:Glycosyl transferase family 2 [Rubripirellula obstinata]
MPTFRFQQNLSGSRTRFGLASEGRLLNSIERALQRTAVIIPARNEQDSLPLVLDDLPNVGVVIIADNGSTDSTAAIAKQAGCQVVSEPIPGYGRACLAAMHHLERFCKDESLAIDYVCFLDGDYSDHPEQLQQILLPILHDESDFVLGSRLLGQRESGSMPPQAVWGNRLACFLMNRIWKTDFTDLGPFRVIRRQSLIDLDMQDLNFGWTVEMQVKAAVAKLRTIEVPVRYRRRVGVSKISGTVSGTIKAGYKILFTIAKYAWKTRNG